MKKSISCLFWLSISFNMAQAQSPQKMREMLTQNDLKEKAAEAEARKQKMDVKNGNVIISSHMITGKPKRVNALDKTKKP